MIQHRWCAALVALMACGGGASNDPVSPAGSASGVVERFMEAVADSNLDRMAEMWGTAAGPASKTRQPADYERRVAIMQAYLRNESHRILPSSVPASGDRQDVQVEIRRKLCTWVVPFTAIRTSSGWLVNQVDLAKAGNPRRPCAPGAPQDTPQPSP